MNFYIIINVLTKTVLFGTAIKKQSNLVWKKSRQLQIHLKVVNFNLNNIFKPLLNFYNYLKC